MTRVAQLLPLLFVVCLCGCKTDGQWSGPSISQEAWEEWAGELFMSKDEKAMQDYRKHWATPGRTEHAIEAEARGTFRRVHGREPD